MRAENDTYAGKEVAGIEVELKEAMKLSSTPKEPPFLSSETKEFSFGFENRRPLKQKSKTRNK